MSEFESIEERCSFSPKSVVEHKVEADLLELRLNRPASYADWEIEVRLGNEKNIEALGTDEMRDLWEGSIPLEIPVAFDSRGDYIPGRAPEMIDANEATRRYNRIRDRIMAGNYISHKYDSGKLYIEIIWED